MLITFNSVILVSLVLLLSFIPTETFNANATSCNWKVMNLLDFVGLQESYFLVRILTI
jgi:hypothetical protein